MNIVSLFSGAGGLDLGFKMAGHNILWANDIDKSAVETYKYNIGEHIFLSDISTINMKDIPKGDIIIGGFPCQGFSIANKNRSENDKRNSLYLEILKLMEVQKPYFFLLENVPGIKSLAKGKVLEMIIKDITDLGYNLTYDILNSADFGVPQVRKRVIFLGIRNDLKYNLNYPRPTHDSLGFNNLPLWRTVRDAISDLPEEPNLKIPNHVGTKYKVKINGYLGNRPTDWDKPSPTILGRGGGTGGPIIIPHPNLHRRMTVRETARLQTFPDDFIFKGSISSQYKQIGNAVPVLMAYALGTIFNFNS